MLINYSFMTFLMSPNYANSNSNAVVFRVNGSDYPGQLNNNWVENSNAVRPVISLDNE